MQDSLCAIRPLEQLYQLEYMFLCLLSYRLISKLTYVSLSLPTASSLRLFHTFVIQLGSLVTCTFLPKMIKLLNDFF